MNSPASQYTLTARDIESITDVEYAFSTYRLLPPEKAVPKEFWDGNIYTRFVEALFYGHPLPDLDMAMEEGTDPQALNRCIRAHLASAAIKHEYKIAAVGYMLSLCCILIPKPQNEESK